jgi:hypothetical protein
VIDGLGLASHDLFELAPRENGRRFGSGGDCAARAAYVDKRARLGPVCFAYRRGFRYSKKLRRSQGDAGFEDRSRGTPQLGSGYSFLPELAELPGKKITLGVIDLSTNEVIESPELVACGHPPRRANRSFAA